MYHFRLTPRLMLNLNWLSFKSPASTSLPGCVVLLLFSFAQMSEVSITVVTPVISHILE